MGIFVLLFVGFLYVARPVVLPVVSAIIIGTLIAPVTRRAADLRIPSWLSAFIAVALLAGLLGLAIVGLSGPVVEWISKAPEIGSRIKELLSLFDRPLAALGDIRNALATPDGKEAALKVDVGGSMMAPFVALVTPAIGSILIFFGTLFFFLAGRRALRHQLVTLPDDRGTRLTILRILNELEQSLATYLAIVTAINLCLGAFMAGALWLIGFPHPLVWGVVVFVLNYIPYLGPALVNVLFLLVGLIAFPNPTQALIAPAIFLAVTTIEGHFLTPSIVGRRLTIHPFAVFLALVFWTWLWGPFGAFLAAPLLIVGIVAAHHLLPKDEVNLPG